MIDYGKFQKALKHLEVQNQNYQGLEDRPSIEELDREAIAESVIQRFEVCYDCLWKVLRRYLLEDLGVPEVESSPKKIFRVANENKLFAAPIEQWLRYADARVGTSHDYSEGKAQEALDLMEDFIDDAIGIYQTMTGSSWA
jgi:nucleotidyltransferase substrate binding protein (TIGR01987 family)